jgi:hypothetical protein
MRTQLIVLFLLVAVFFGSCKSQQETKNYPKSNPEKTQMVVDTIPYTIAQNYFVKNTVESIPNPKIETEEALKKYFGFATTMGKDGKPSVINFSNEFAIALVLPQTDLATTIKPVLLKKEKDNSILFHYQIEIGSKQSFTSRPFLLLVVDKKYDGNIILERVN